MTDRQVTAEKRAELKALLQRQHEALKFRKLHKSKAQTPCRVCGFCNCVRHR